jgi:hypothetical protein
MVHSRRGEWGVREHRNVDIAEGSRQSRGAHGRVRPRLAFLGFTALAPTLALAWSGCSDDKQGPAVVVVDPGGTHGAEISVTVIGPGRVTADLPGLDCPSRCFAAYVFTSADADGAAGAVTLRAITRPGVRFAGWAFDPAPLGSRGRGPTACNPVLREASLPAVDMSAEEISLPYGESEGTPPPGQEGACGAYTAVPLAYSVTATFEEIPVPDAGPDADAGPGEILFESPVSGAVGQELGIIGNRLYWRFTSGGTAGIATASSSGGAASVVVPATQPIPKFEVDSHVVYQVNDGTLRFILGGGTAPQTLTGAPLTCDSVESDPSAIYCLSDNGIESTLRSWTTSAVGPTTLFTGLPRAKDRFAVDTTYFYFVSDPGGAGSAKIVRVPRVAGDGGVAEPEDLVFNQTNPIRLEDNGSRLFWINYDAPSIAGELRSSSSFGGAASIAVSLRDGLRFLALDPSSTQTIWAATVPTTGEAGEILRASATGAFTPEPVVSGVGGSVGGLAVDAAFVYWTQSDGTVRRVPKN